MDDAAEYNKSPEDKKKFAKEQYEFLKNEGIDDRMRLSRIFKAAGPGQIQEAWKLATCEDWEEETNKNKKEMLASVLIGADFLELSRECIEQILDQLLFYIPTAHNEDCFFRVLQGAVEIMFPGSHEFSEREMAEIKEGLKKRVYDKDE
jgi:hypothetical protein